ncbi:MAG: hypothetical protein IAG10_30905, partial [Planctomycetaceae bacterium]|nr:hypothetical protein [Planctomycetaceae bacterium]
MLSLVAQHVRRNLRLMAFGLSVWVLAASGFAQTTNNPPASETPTSKPQPPGTPARSLKAGMDDVFEVLGKDGQILFLPHWRTLEKFEQWL